MLEKEHVDIYMSLLEDANFSGFVLGMLSNVQNREGGGFSGKQ
jgi:hypothetical protein